MHPCVMTVNSRPGCGRSSLKASWAERAQVRGLQPLGPTLKPLRRGPEDPGSLTPSPPLPTGVPSSLDTRKSLVQYVTMVIFNCSAKHYAISAGQVRWGSAGAAGWRGPGSWDSLCLLGLQFDSCVWMPNLPPTMQLPPPTSKGQTEPEGFIAALPPVNATCDIVFTLWLLSQEPGDRVSVGPGARGCEGVFPLPLPSRIGVPSPPLSHPAVGGAHEHGTSREEGQMIKCADAELP